MRTLFMAVALIFSAHAQATPDIHRTPLNYSMLSDGGKFLGLEDGIYVGGGQWEVRSKFQRTKNFITRIKLAGDQIEIRTQASWLGFTTDDMTARLKLVQTGLETFVIYDVDTGGIAGAGQCHVAGCTLDVNLKGGTWSMIETWTPSASGIIVTNGKHTIDGQDYRYKSFQKKN